MKKETSKKQDSFDDIEILDRKKNEVNDIVKELQSKITLHEIV